jgi:hypothetical protein
MFSVLEADSNGEVGSKSVPHVNAGRTGVKVIFTKSVFAIGFGEIPFPVRVIILCVTQVNRIQNIKSTQSEIDIRSLVVDVIARMQIEQTVTRDLPGLTSLVFTVQTEGVEISKVSTEEGETGLQIHSFISIFQGHSILALR